MLYFIEIERILQKELIYYICIITFFNYLTKFLISFFFLEKNKQNDTLKLLLLKVILHFYFILHFFKI